MFDRYLAVAALAVAGTVSAPAGAGAMDFLLTLENSGQTLRFDRAPAFIVSIGQGGSKMLHALGLGSNVGRHPRHGSSRTCRCASVPTRG